MWVPSSGAEHEKVGKPTTRSKKRVALYCYCGIETWERSSDGTRRYLDRGGFAHRGRVYRLSRFWPRHLRFLLVRALTGARSQAEERGGTEHERGAHFVALRGPALAAGTEIVDIVAVINDLTR